MRTWTPSASSVSSGSVPKRTPSASARAGVGRVVGVDRQRRPLRPRRRPPAPGRGPGCRGRGASRRRCRRARSPWCRGHGWRSPVAAVARRWRRPARSPGGRAPARRAARRARARSPHEAIATADEATTAGSTPARAISCSVPATGGRSDRVAAAGQVDHGQGQSGDDDRRREDHGQQREPTGDGRSRQHSSGKTGRVDSGQGAGLHGATEPPASPLPTALTCHFRHRTARAGAGRGRNLARRQVRR